MQNLCWRILGINLLLTWTAHSGLADVALAPVPLESGPDHVLWRVTNQVKTAQGVISVPSQFVQLESGLNRWDANTASWVATDPTIELFQDGAIVRNLQYSVIFSPNLANPGAVDIQLADGQRLRGQIMGIAYTFGGQSVLAAQVRDCVGEVRGNEILFRSAFTDIDADVKFIVYRGSLSQHLILKERLPHPSIFGLNEDAHVEVMTEWTDLPPVAKESRTLEPAAGGQRALTHERINLGAMEFIGGHAFDVEGTASVPVASSLESIENRNFLLEKIPWRKLSPENDKLPAPQAANIQRPVNPLIRAQAGRALPAKRTVKRTIKPVQMAQAAFAYSKALVWDWELVSSVNKQIWRPDTTYYISGSVTVKTNEFWGNTVIKFAPTNAARLTVTGPITTYADMYRPITLTARDDHTLGAAIGTNTVSGYYADVALYLDSYTSGITYDLENFRVRHASAGISFYTGDSHSLAHGSIVKCGRALLTYYCVANFRNLVVHDCGKVVDSSINTTNRFENATLWKSTNAWTSTNGIFCVTNSVLAELTYSGTLPFYGGDYNYTYASGSDVFATVGAGSVYLKPGSSPIGAATTNITPSLLTALRQRTTAAPMILSNRVSLDTVLTRFVQRDTDALDCGAHLPPIDYCVFGVGVSNATLLITNGVAIATFGTVGIYLENGGKLISAGTPLSLNRFFPYYAVQEQPTNWLGAGPNSAITVYTYWDAVPPSMDFRWTAFDTFDSSAYHLYSDYGINSLTNCVVRDCQFRSGQIYLFENDTGSCTFTNNLFEYNTWYVFDPKYLRFHNNIFVAANGFLSQTLSNQNWSFTDNLLDTSPVVNFSPGMIHDYNGLYNSADFYSNYNTNAHEKILSSLSYQTGGLARYYLPTNSTLLNAGSTTNAALVGLYGFTTLTNNIAELTNPLDISWHLPALDGYGMLLDSDGDGIPDIFEDRNGNGVYDSSLGETDRATYNSILGIGPGTGLTVFTPLKP